MLAWGAQQALLLLLAGAASALSSAQGSPHRGPLAAALVAGWLDLAQCRASCTLGPAQGSPGLPAARGQERMREVVGLLNAEVSACQAARGSRRLGRRAVACAQGKPQSAASMPGRNCPGRCCISLYSKLGLAAVAKV